MNLKIKKFNMSQIRDDEIIVFIGKRRTGKSFLVKDLLYHHADIPVGCVISPTEMANGFFGEIVPKIFIHDEYEPPIVDNYMKRQAKFVKNIKKGNPDYVDKDPMSFLIFDDCLYDNSWVKDRNIRSIFMNGRHYKTMFLLTMQYSLGITPNLRTNIDYVFILREPDYNNRKKLYEHYCGMFPSLEIFCQVMDQCTENYECLVISKNCKSNKLEDQVFWYRAENRPKFKMGADIFWKTSEEYCFEDDDDDFKSSVSQVRKSKGPRIMVKKY